MSPLVSIIIVNWNSREDLKECFESLFKISYKNYEVIMVDNGSKDDSVEFVEKNFPKVFIAKSKVNLGFAGGNNLGFKESHGEYILLLNNDTIVPPDFLGELVNFMEKRKDVGIVQPKILFHRPGTPLHHRINSVGSFFLSTGFLYHLNYGKNDSKISQQFEILSAYGACFLARRSLIDKIGLFDDDYFAYFEETDLSQRVWLSGLKVMIDPSSTIYHKGAKTSQKLPTAFIQYHSFKNRLQTYLKNLSFSNLFKIFIPHLLICEISSVLYFFVGKPDYTLAIQKAIFWNLLNLGGILKKRQIVQKFRKVSDNEFIPKLTRKVNLRYYYFLSRGELEKYND